MRWFNRIQIITGQTCAHILMHLLIIVSLIAGWMHKQLIAVSMGLLVAYVLVFTAMLLAQRFKLLRKFSDYLEEATTTYYFGAAMLLLFLISNFIGSALLLSLLGVTMLLGPALVSLLRKERDACLAKVAYKRRGSK